MVILVFDDDLVHRTGFLGGLPAQFIYRAHADDALRDVDEVEPDVVLMDFSMGHHLSGAQAVALLRSRYPVGELHIVGISSDARCNAQMCRAGADDAIVKREAPTLLRQLLLDERAADDDDDDD